MGNLFLSPPNIKKIEKNAAEFLVDKVSEYPGEVSILALGPLTNIALVSCNIFSFILWPQASQIYNHTTKSGYLVLFIFVRQSKGILLLQAR